MGDIADKLLGPQTEWKPPKGLWQRVTQPARATFGITGNIAAQLARPFLPGSYEAAAKRQAEALQVTPESSWMEQAEALPHLGDVLAEEVPDPFKGATRFAGALVDPTNLIPVARAAGAAAPLARFAGGVGRSIAGETGARLASRAAVTAAAAPFTAAASLVYAPELLGAIEHGGKETVAALQQGDLGKTTQAALATAGAVGMGALVGYGVARELPALGRSINPVTGMVQRPPVTDASQGLPDFGTAPGMDEAAIRAEAGFDPDAVPGSIADVWGRLGQTPAPAAAPAGRGVVPGGIADVFPRLPAPSATAREASAATMAGETATSPQAMAEQAAAAAVGTPGVNPRKKLAATTAPASTVASVPFMITRRMEAALAQLGFSKAQISAMTPAEAQKILAAPTPMPAAPVVDELAEEAAREAAYMPPDELPPMAAVAAQTAPPAPPAPAPRPTPVPLEAPRVEVPAAPAAPVAAAPQAAGEINPLTVDMIVKRAPATADELVAVAAKLDELYVPVKRAEIEAAAVQLGIELPGAPAAKAAPAEAPVKIDPYAPGRSVVVQGRKLTMIPFAGGVRMAIDENGVKWTLNKHPYKGIQLTKVVDLTGETPAAPAAPPAPPPKPPAAAPQAEYKPARRIEEQPDGSFNVVETIGEQDVTHPGFKTQAEADARLKQLDLIDRAADELPDDLAAISKNRKATPEQKQPLLDWFAARGITEAADRALVYKRRGGRAARMKAAAAEAPATQPAAAPTAPAEAPAPKQAAPEPAPAAEAPTAPPAAPEPQLPASLAAQLGDVYRLGPAERTDWIQQNVPAEQADAFQTALSRMDERPAVLEQPETLPRGLNFNERRQPQHQGQDRGSWLRPRRGQGLPGLPHHQARRGPAAAW